MLKLRQRALLDVLGIPVWISRKRHTQAAATSSAATIWRDLANIEYVDVEQVDIVPATVVQATSPVVRVEPVVSVETAITKQQPTDAMIDAPTPVSIKTHLTETLVAARAAEITQTKAVAQFHLQVFETAQWLVLINAAELQNPQADQLWRNIQLAFQQPTVYRFSWPLAEGQRWQNGLGAKAALNGFLFRMGLDKRAGLIGDLPDEICPDRLERLPRLSELLQEPLKKRLLWQVLKSASS